MKKSKLRFWIFLTPALISFGLVVLIPMLIGFFYAFTNWNGIVGSSMKFVGLLLGFTWQFIFVSIFEAL